MPLTADTLYQDMYEAIDVNDARTVSNPPQQAITHEARPGRCFALHQPHRNLVTVRKVDERWARANLLHFFACTEKAMMLPQYNRFADRYMTNGYWRGAYGPIALPQIKECAKLLRQDFNTRRAIVSMGGFEEDPDVNRPACWSFLHFLSFREQLDLLVYQRSLNLYGVMPYDLIVLSNVLLYVAHAVGITPGALRWTIGSLHIPAEDHIRPLLERRNVQPIIYPYAMLDDADECYTKLMKNDLS